MNPRRQWVAVVTLILILNLLAVYISNTSGNIVSSELRPFSVSEVFDNVLLDEDVFVKGKVTEALEDHTSKKGFVYQQFVISDGKEEIKVFCSVKYGRAEVSKGDEIVFDGEFKKYYNQYEIYGFCSEIQVE